jgi:Protein of unknown function (DUF2934)
MAAVYFPGEGRSISMAKKTTTSNREASTRRRASTSKSDAASESPTGSAQAANGRATDEDIRRLAYELYLSRGGAHGFEVDDWLRAERQLETGPEEHRTG